MAIYLGEGHSDVTPTTEDLDVTVTTCLAMADKPGVKGSTHIAPPKNSIVQAGESPKWTFIIFVHEVRP